MSLFNLIHRDQDEDLVVVDCSNDNQPALKLIDHQAKAEKLKFLKPCPLCQGREFTHGKNGGFFCNVCQPDVIGLPVIALGRRVVPQSPVKKKQQRVKRVRLSREEQAQICFQVGFPWIMENLKKLLEAGWSRPSLFRRGKQNWPYGKYGAAWSSGWIKKDVLVSIDERSGAIYFTFTSTEGRKITLAEYPPIPKKV